jgi:hypothetical protein
VTDYFRALLLRHAAVSEDLAGDPLSAWQDPLAVAPSDRDAVAFRDDGPRPLPMPARLPVAGRPAESAPPASRQSPVPLLTPRQTTRPNRHGETPLPVRPAVTAGLPGAMTPHHPAVATDAEAAGEMEAPNARDAIASGSTKGSAAFRAAGASHARPAEAPPPVAPATVSAIIDAMAVDATAVGATPSAEAASVPPLAPRAEAADHALPHVAGTWQAAPEGNGTSILAAIGRDATPEPTRRSVAASSWPAPAPPRRPLSEAHGADASSLPPKPPLAVCPPRGNHADDEGSMPPAVPAVATARHDAVVHADAAGSVSSLDCARQTSGDSASGHRAPAVSSPGSPQMSMPHTAGRDLTSPTAAVSPDISAPIGTAASLAIRHASYDGRLAEVVSPMGARTAPAAGQPHVPTGAPNHGVRVSIDRLELRAASPAPARPAPAKQTPPGRRIGLDDYAARLHTGRRTGAGS